MTTFLRLLSDSDKAAALAESCARVRQGMSEPRCFEVETDTFDGLPGRPFAYWCSDTIRAIFHAAGQFENKSRSVKFGLSTTDDYRFVRVWWEVDIADASRERKWPSFVKGGRHSRYYSDILAVVNWGFSGKELYANSGIPFGGSGAPMRNPQAYFKRGMTWPLRGIVFSSQAVPDGCIFSSGGKMAFAPDGEIGGLLALFNSTAFDSFIALYAGKVGGVQYEVGLIQKMPIPSLGGHVLNELALLVLRCRNPETVGMAYAASGFPS